MVEVEGMDVSSMDRVEIDKQVGDLIANFPYKIAGDNDKVFKDECMYCFDTPYSPGGLYLSLKTFAGYCEKHMEFQKEGCYAFVHLKREVIPLELNDTQSSDSNTNITLSSLCQEPKTREEVQTSLVLHPFFKHKIPISELSGDVLNACLQVQGNCGARVKEQLESGVSSWDGEMKIITKHLNLVQIDNGKKVPPSGWKCETEGCDLTENLWLNLTDGAIKCGRSQYIQEGVKSKGNNHMRQHFDLTGYPLVVKLGTISNGTADVFSYDEDDSVEDPNLEIHLAHFGIDMRTAEKTEKSTLELELSMNQKWEWSMCQEDGTNLELAYGPGLTGMINIGSSCYINASMQMFLQVPDMTRAYSDFAEQLFSKVSAVGSHENFNCQTAKVISCLMSGHYSKEGSKFNGIKPTQFKKVVGKGHPEFSTSRQQDAEEFIRYFLTLVDDNLKGLKDIVNPVDSFRFNVETRFEDCGSKKVRYRENEELVLSLTVPINIAQKIQSNDPSGVARSFLRLNDCFAATFADQFIPDFRSPVTGEICGANQRIRLATFPDFLILQLKKFTVEDDLTVKKMDVDVEPEEHISLKAFQGLGLQPGEQSLEDGSVVYEPIMKRIEPHIDEGLLVEVTSMGFSQAAVRRAVHMSKSSNSAVVTDWLLSHLDDPDINDPLPTAMEPLSASESARLIGQLMETGFSEYASYYALRKVGGDLTEAANWLIANIDNLPTPPSSNRSQVKNTNPGGSDYRLIGFISHMGTSPHSGHYVAHLKKNGVWYLFNDEKVAISQNPPARLAYMYLYQRV